MPNSSDDAVDKDQLYGRYQRPMDERAKIEIGRRKWQDRLHQQVSHSALDEPLLEDEMGDITSTRISGLGWKEIAAIGALGLGGFYLFNNNQQVEQPPVVAPALPAAQEGGDPEYRPILRPGRPQE